MILGEKWKIFWTEYAANTYLYGSEIIFHKKDDVEFINQLMPPGTMIKQWYSQTNFQMQKVEPALPIIDGEGAYQITVDIDKAEEENLLIRLVFFDKYGVEAGTCMVRDKVTIFRCPLKTYSYRLQLINGGVKKLRFHSIVIQEVMDEKE